MLFFAQSKKDEPPTTKLTHSREIAEYCKTRIAQIEAVVPVLDLYSVRGYVAFSPHRRAARQVEQFKHILSQIEGQESEQLIAQNVKNLAASPILVPYGRDILSIMRTGKQVLPLELEGIAEYLEKEKREAEAARIRLGIQRKEKAKLEEQAKIEAEKRAKREALAAEIGVSPEKLENLVQG